MTETFKIVLYKHFRETASTEKVNIVKWLTDLHARLIVNVALGMDLADITYPCEFADGSIKMVTTGEFFS